jgi:hypothetical protein
MRPYPGGSSTIARQPSRDGRRSTNWKKDANPVVNPFGNAIVIAIGAAGPLRTPLIGPPVPFE